MSEPEDLFFFDENLRDLPKDPALISKKIEELKIDYARLSSPMERCRSLGARGVYLRTLGYLDEAEQHLQDALALVKTEKLGIGVGIQQKIRLAHVFQWQGRFDLSNPLFSEILKICSEDEEANVYLPFAWQHAGKNAFDQKDFQVALTMFEKALALRLTNGASRDQIESSNFAIAQTRLRLSKS